MDIKIKPHKLKGIVNVPASKSLMHRAIICASLSHGKSIISNITLSNDINATINEMRNFGADIKLQDNKLVIEGFKHDLLKDEVDSNESGSTLRFLIPIFLTKYQNITFIGHNNLVNRPLDPYLKIFDKLNIRYQKGNKTLPLKVFDKLKSGEFHILGNVSSQFISGLLFALPILNGDSKIIIEGELESLNYIDLTIDMLKAFGIDILFDKDKNIIYVKGDQEYMATNYTCEGDFSQASFFLVANMLGSEIGLKNLKLNTLQGDSIILDILKKMKASFYLKDNILYLKKNDILNMDISLKNCPDLGPILSVLLSFAKGKSRLYDAGRLRLKECDRITCVVNNLKKLNIDIKEGKDFIEINGNNKIKGGVLDSCNDHRLAMSFAIISTAISEELTILNMDAINKSYPEFLNDFKSLGGIYERIR
jgi:3-phosphoshikimate 1-carboxyvinyltransferase